jgi:hypothetical protein
VIARLTFARHTRVPIDAACVVANGVREALRALLGENCTVTMGEPVALAPPAWHALTQGALVFETPGYATDVAFVLRRTDARLLVDSAFGEEPAHPGTWSALERDALERIVARCAGACDVLCAERRGPTRAADPAALPGCVAFFDVRVTAPVTLTLGVGVLRDLPEPLPAVTLSPAVLGGVGLAAQVILGRARISAGRLLELRIGDIVTLETKVGEDGELKVAGQGIADGICGVVRGRAAFAVRSLYSRGEW